MMATARIALLAMLACCASPSTQDVVAPVAIPESTSSPRLEPTSPSWAAPDMPKRDRAQPVLAASDEPPPSPPAPSASPPPPLVCEVPKEITEVECRKLLHALYVCRAHELILSSCDMVRRNLLEFPELRPKCRELRVKLREIEGNRCIHL